MHESIHNMYVSTHASYTKQDESIHNMHVSTHASYTKQDGLIHTFMGRCILSFDTIQNQLNLYESIHNTYASTHPICIKQDESIHAFMGRCMLSFAIIQNQSTFMSSTQAFMDPYKRKTLFVGCFDLVPTKHNFSNTRTTIFLYFGYRLINNTYTKYKTKVLGDSSRENLKRGDIKKRKNQP